MSDAATLMTDGANQQADTSTASTDAAAAQAAGANTDATQQAAATDTSTDAANADKSAEAQNAAPEKYEFQAPEGVSFDTELLGEFEGIAKELKLSQADAQKVTNIGAKLAQKFEAQQALAVTKLATEWVEAATNDKEYGGEKLQENLAVARKAMTAFGSPDLQDLMEKTGLGNNPEVIRFMFRAGKAISEDRLVVGGASNTSSNQKTTSDILYNNTQGKN